MNKFINIKNGEIKVTTYRDPNATATTLSDMLSNANESSNLTACLDIDELIDICDWAQTNDRAFCSYLNFERLDYYTKLKITVEFDEYELKTIGDLSELDWRQALECSADFDIA